MKKLLGQVRRVQLPEAPSPLWLRVEFMISTALGLLLGRFFFVLAGVHPDETQEPYVLLGLWITINVFFMAHRTPDKKGIDFRVW
jgi:hypothetical protein